MRHGPSAGKPQSGLATGERPRCVSTCALLFCLGLILLSPQCPHAAQTGHPCPLAWPFIEEVTRLPTPRSWGGAWGRGVGSILTLRYVSKDATCDLSWESPWRDIMPGPPFPPHRGLVPVVSLLLSSHFLLFLVWLQFPDSRFVPITKSLSHTQFNSLSTLPLDCHGHLVHASYAPEPSYITPTPTFTYPPLTRHRPTGTKVTRRSYKINILLSRLRPFPS